MTFSLTKKLQLVAWAAILAATPSVAATNDVASVNSTNSTDISLEELINIDVTSVSKKETKLEQSPAAIYVVTPEDMARSGVSSLPDALRLVPGLDVAQVNSSDWAISSRGFNSQFANKLLVLVDGRSIYNLGFGGELWEMQDFVLEDLDRIEVIRGPGGTLWGADAVNGVININTKSAKDTQGFLVSSELGSEQQPAISARYGGQLGSNLFFRVFGQYANQDGFVDQAGNEDPDDRNIVHGGARLDWEPGQADRFTLEGNYFNAEFGAIAQSPSLTPPYFTDFSGLNHKTDGNVQGKWAHDLSDTSQFTLQSYYDRSVDMEEDIASTENVYDIDFQHRFGLWDWNDIVWGAGFQYFWDDSPPSFDLTFNPPQSRDQFYSTFLQDDVTVVEDRFHVILGSKFEHNPDTGFEVQPSGRLLWTPSENQTVWGAVSRAVRTPTRFDTDSTYNQLTVPPGPPTFLPILVTILGNPEFRSEELIAYELGYRIEPAKQLSFDLATFYNVYKDLNTQTAGTPFFVATPIPHLVLPEYTYNSLSGDTYGAELSAQWRVSDDWKIIASYSWLHMNLNPSDLTSGDSPQHQFQIRSYLNLTKTTELNAAVYYVSSLPDQQVPSYVRADLGVVWRPNRNWEFGIWGENLVGEHTEFGSYRTPDLSEVPRNIFGKVVWRF
jgi:iron complex outermembrane recepter protein